jgi:uracil-DNA glycosylase family 4
MSVRRELLNWYKEMGVDAPILTKQGKSRKNNNQAEVAVIEESISETRVIADSCKSLAELEQMIRAFEGCELKQGAKNTVFADGNPNSKLLLIGEAPGANEDEQGIPFCGQSGKLLDNILLGIGIKRADVYITNTVFWRPPGNRRPTSVEIDMCRPFVEKHIALIKPELIILVGNTAVESLLNLKVAMHSLRGKVFSYSNRYLEQPINTVSIFHPSYLLRQLLKKKDMWMDIAKIKQQFL